MVQVTNQLRHVSEHQSKDKGKIHFSCTLLFFSGKKLCNEPIIIFFQDPGGRIGRRISLIA